MGQNQNNSDCKKKVIAFTKFHFPLKYLATSTSDKTYFRCLKVIIIYVISISATNFII
jgi:hypothetical protein